jgi:hypothetical protein
MYCFFLLFNILDHICTTCFIFVTFSGKSFRSLFSNSQRYRNDLQEAFVRFEISSPVSNAFPLTK